MSSAYIFQVLTNCNGLDLKVYWSSFSPYLEPILGTCFLVGPSVNDLPPSLVAGDWNTQLWLYDVICSPHCILLQWYGGCPTADTGNLQTFRPEEAMLENWWKLVFYQNIFLFHEKSEPNSALKNVTKQKEKLTSTYVLFVWSDHKMWDPHHAVRRHQDGHRWDLWTSFAEHMSVLLHSPNLI